MTAILTLDLLLAPGILLFAHRLGPGHLGFPALRGGQHLEHRGHGGADPAGHS